MIGLLIKWGGQTMYYHETGIKITVMKISWKSKPKPQKKLNAAIHAPKLIPRIKLSKYC